MATALSIKLLSEYWLESKFQNWDFGCTARVVGEPDAVPVPELPEPVHPDDGVCTCVVPPLCMERGDNPGAPVEDPPTDWLGVAVVAAFFGLRFLNGTALSRVLDLVAMGDDNQTSLWLSWIEPRGRDAILQTRSMVINRLLYSAVVQLCLRRS
ncbi:hypothetical protein DL95DRAFT_418733 [Leptodontidium sp. 2 PMI_412]|nr:hypothetical protein DL95DRAFT_418733 [Leptodontidium sp. 2 PMI_412]